MREQSPADDREAFDTLNDMCPDMTVRNPRKDEVYVRYEGMHRAEIFRRMAEIGWRVDSVSPSARGNKVDVYFTPFGYGQ